MIERFADRQSAGRALAERVQGMKPRPPVVVLALPRGGVPVAVPVAEALGAPLDLLLVRKIGLPWQPELALAAVVDGEHPEVVIDDEVQAASALGPDYIEEQTALALKEIARRREVYLRGREALRLEGCCVVVVDDGIATGTTMRAALRALRRRHPARLMLAVPVAPAAALEDLRGEVDDLVCLRTPAPFWAIGAHYADFHQLADEEVLSLMEQARSTYAAAQAAAAPGAGTAGRRS